MAIFAVSIFSLVALSYGFNINPRIINGDLSKAEDFPFYVSLDGEVTTCGATLLSDRSILFNFRGIPWIFLQINRGFSYYCVV